MSRTDTEPKDGSGSLDTSTATTRLTGSCLIVARTVWLILVIPSVGLFLASFIVSYQQSLIVCVTPATCNLSGELPVQMQHSLASIGLSVSAFALFNTIFFALTAAVWYTVGFLIFWRRSDDWLALLAAFFLVMFNVTTSGNTTNALQFAYPGLALPLSLLNFLGQVSLLVFFLLFPNGRLVPRWMGLILLLVILEQFLTLFPCPSLRVGQCGSAAGVSRCLYRHYLFTNLPLQTCVYTFPTPTDKVDHLRGDSGNWSSHMHFVLVLLPKQ